MGKDKDTVEQDVLEFLKTQNRPYSANDLTSSSALKEHGKSAVQKALDQLVISGTVKEKTYNKQKVYVIDQNLLSSGTDQDIAQIDSRIAELTREIAEDESVIKRAENELKAMGETLSIEELQTQIAQLQEENKKMREKLEAFASNKVKVSAGEFKKVAQMKEKSASELRKRKRICVDMLDQILEGYPKGKKALIEEIGLELD